MNAELLFRHFDRLSYAPYTISNLRKFVLDLAVRGKLSAQNSNDEPASELLKRIRSYRARLAKGGKRLQSPRPIDSDAVPFDVPKGWEWTRIGELGFTQTGTTPPKTHTDYFGTFIPFVKPGDLLPNRVDYTNEALSESGLRHSGRSAPAGSLLMVCIGTIGKCQLIDRECSFNQQINSLSPFADVSPRFILIACLAEYFQQAANAASARTTISILSKAKWEILLLPLPPLAEQHRIVAKVDELMALCDRLEAAQAERENRRDRLVAASLHRLNNGADADTFREHARFYFNHLPRLTTRPEHIMQLRAAILDLAIRGRLVPQDGNDEPISELFKRIEAERKRAIQDGEMKKLESFQPVESSEVPFSIPLGWSTVRMGWIARKLGAGNTPLGGKNVYENSGVPFLRSQNVYNTGLKLDDVAYIPRSVHDRMSGTHVLPEDVLLNITGASIGRCALVPSTFAEGNVSQHVAIIRLFDPSIREFVHLSLISPRFQKLIDNVQVGVSREGLSMQRLRLFPMLIPPVPEQHRIVAKVSELMAVCDRLEAQIVSREAVSRRLLEALLYHALADTPDAVPA